MGVGVYETLVWVGGGEWALFWVRGGGGEGKIFWGGWGWVGRGGGGCGGEWRWVHCLIIS